MEVRGLELFERAGEENAQLLVLGVFDDELEVQRRVLRELALEDQELLLQAKLEVARRGERDRLQLEQVAWVRPGYL